MTSDDTRDGRALRDVAKLAAPAPRKIDIPSADSSGFVDLGALMATNPTWLDDAIARAKDEARTIKADSVSPMAVTAAAQPVREVPLSPEIAAGVPRSRVWPIAVGATAVALAVGVASVLAIRHRAPLATAPAPVMQAVAAPAKDPVNPPPVAAAPPVTEAAPAGNVADPPPTFEADDTPVAKKTAAPSRVGRKGAKYATSAPHPRAGAPNTVAAPPSSLDSALRAAAGGASESAPPKPAADATSAAATAHSAEGRPARPSGSLVTNALTQALPAARACLGNASEPSRATVVFGSEGAVQRVDVTGPAASNAKASQCLRAAFGKAIVPPFSQSTYSASVNVRPR